ncbi:hypothetical protein GOD47_01415 [Sinorhizobium medicae]|nr:hypothetical protein [Sinorhizobium medicae]MDX0662671.1 hypothetical protein [Sinorhizobium medicae]MDX0723724.1 hypothetical protein [Sinorhizobium medicae]MDX0729796.1 hypothetical protein [Sinorhizobium medicae]MDX0809885.1 hypothetical protein [Sinorhizobium medicae]
MKKGLSVSFRVEPDGPPLKVNGRNAWALLELHKAGERGCTPITTPGPRWSGYVFNLRRMGLAIETIQESHGGPFPGLHARYVARSRISILEEVI